VKELVPGKCLVKGDKLPRQILVDEGWRQVEGIVDHWREAGRWWAGERPREFFLVETSQGAFVVSRTASDWQVERRMD